MSRSWRLNSLNIFGIVLDRLGWLLFEIASKNVGLFLHTVHFNLTVFFLSLQPSTTKEQFP